MRSVTLVCTLALPLLTAGCGKDPLAAFITPTVSVTVTDTFTGTVTRNGATSHPFPVTSTGGGNVTATLTAVNPDSGAVLGLSLGTWNGSACQAVVSNDRATVSVAILGRATSTGTLCVRVYDIGALNEPQDYEIQVVHP